MDFNLTHILVSNKNKLFTYLNRYNEKKSTFEGEYSIVHNEHSGDSYFLSKFLVNTKGSQLTLMDSNNPHYTTIINQFGRFLEDDIYKYVEEKQLKNIENEKYIEAHRNLGQFQISVIKKMVEKQLEQIRSNPGDTPEAMRIALGKELSLEWVLHMIKDVVEKGQ